MIYTFGDFELDTELFELRCAGETVRVEPQVFDVLSHLVRHRDRVVTKDELLQEVWSDRFVSEATLSSRLMAARKALGDDGRTQAFIRTHHGRGYRFVAAVEERSEVPVAGAVHTSAPAAEPLPESAAAPPVALVGREPELALLTGALERAAAGARQAVFVSGEPGLGKTTLVEAFLDRARGAARVGHGQCLEHRGPGEAYMPVLEALSRMCREPGGSEIVALLAHRAPTWLVQMPWLMEPAELEALQARVLGVTRERMLREMVEALEALSADRPLVLVLEDLHWSDHSTVDLLAWAARRHEPARLVLLGTYRPAGLAGGAHPLGKVTRELSLRGQATEVRLGRFAANEVDAYLAARFGGAALPEGLGEVLLRRTEGNPLFMGNVLDFWIGRGSLVESDGGWAATEGLEALAAGVPETLRALIEEQLGRLNPDDLEVLEAASVAGQEFAAATVAAGVAHPEDQVERRCADLARRGLFITGAGTAEWPDRTVSSCFAFLHDLYHEVLYERVTAGRRVRLHRWIGDRLETGYGDRSGERAAELALHFVRGRDIHRAIDYLERAAHQALARSAHREAVGHLRAALDLVAGLPEAPERDARELGLLSTLGPALIATEGWGSPEAERALSRAYDLARGVGDRVRLVAVLFGLATLHEYRGEYGRSQNLMEERLRMIARADRESEPLVLEAHELLACSLFHQGGFEAAVEHAGEALSLYDPATHRVVTAAYGDNPAASCHHWAALSLWFLGRPDTALARSRQALELASDPAHQYSLAHARCMAAWLRQLRREPEECRALAEAAVELGAARGFPYHVATGTMLRAWARAMTGDGEDPEDGAEPAVEELRRGLEAYRATGAAIDDPYYLALLAEALAAAGRPEEALAAVAEGKACLRGDRSFYYEADLHRLEGELTLATGDRASEPRAESALRHAVAVAGDQKALALEIRAAVSLGRFLAARGDNGEAHALVAPRFARFTEGLETPDLVAARTLLDELAAA